MGFLAQCQALDDHKSGRCVVCHRDPNRANNGFNSECSHVDCPHRNKVTAQAPDLYGSCVVPEEPQ